MKARAGTPGRLSGRLQRFGRLSWRTLPSGVATLLLTAALFEPWWTTTRDAYDLVITLDVTQSMNVLDYEIDGKPASRLAYARKVLRQALPGLPCGSRVGWAAFSEYRVLLRLAPVEVCANCGDLVAMLDRIDGRIAWVNASEIAKGIFWGRRTVRELGGSQRFVFLTDGHESPPLNPQYRPLFDGQSGPGKPYTYLDQAVWQQKPVYDDKPGDIRGLIVGVGGDTLRPIPRFDADGRAIGFRGVSQVLQTDVFSTGAGDRASADPAAAGSAAGPPPGVTEHLSSLRSGHLKQIAGDAGLGYHRLVDAPAAGADDGGTGPPGAGAGRPARSPCRPGAGAAGRRATAGADRAAGAVPARGARGRNRHGIGGSGCSRCLRPLSAACDSCRRRRVRCRSPAAPAAAVWPPVMAGTAAAYRAAAKAAEPPQALAPPGRMARLSAPVHVSGIACEVRSQRAGPCPDGPVEAAATHGTDLATAAAVSLPATSGCDFAGTQRQKETSMESRHHLRSAGRRLAAGLLAAGLALGMINSAGAADPEPPLGVNVLEATFKWRPNYVSDDMLLNADKDANNWLHYGKDYQGTRFSQLSQIDRGNVRKLVPKWNMAFGVNDAQDSQTTVVNGRIYVTASQNKVFSVDAATGRIIWKYERSLPGDLGPRLCCEAVNRGVAVYKDMVFMATLDTHVVALNNTTGKVVWETKLGDYKTGEIYTSMPLVAKGKVIVGNSGGDVGGNVGKITALDPDTGSIIWQTNTRPTSASDPAARTWANDSWKTGGASAWLTGTYDTKTNSILWGVGNPTPDFDPSIRKGDNLYSNSTLALDPDTGRIKFHFQYTPNDAWDYDGNNEVILVNDEKGRQAWLHADRNGHLYSIDRSNGKCNWVVPIARVNWVTGFGDNCRPIVNPDKAPRYDKVITDIAPILDGGKEWHPAAYSPRTKLIYVPYIDSSMDIQAKNMEWKRGEWFLSSRVLRANPYTGGIKAFNATTGELVWNRPQSTPATSGLIATAGGLVFSGDAEGHFAAMRDDTGETLWRFQVGTGIHGNPTTFSVDGKQYVAIVYGPGGGSLWPLVYDELFKHQNRGGGMMVFGLAD